MLDRDHVERLTRREDERFREQYPGSRQRSMAARDHMLCGAPLQWMREWQSPFTIYVDNAAGAEIEDVDGNVFADFCLGDTGAMFGHSPPALLEAAAREMPRGITQMLPVDDCLWLGEELSRRFVLKYWSFALTATDANRFACRFARELTGRSKILVFNGCYHGSLGEASVDLVKGRVVRRKGSVGIVEPPESTTRVVEFNDLGQLDSALAEGDVACVLAEPALTNCSMVLPEEGFHDGLRELTRKHGTLLIIDETHTISTSESGYTGAYGLDPDMLTLGKPIGGGIPAAVYGFSAEIGERAQQLMERNNDFSTGIGGTLSGNAFSLRAMRAMFEQVITADAYRHMFAMASILEEGIRESIERHGLPWHVSRLGARVEYGTSPEPWRTGSEVHAGADTEVERLVHLYCLNRGVLVTPFHNMLLTSPVTEEQHVRRHNEAFDGLAGELATGSVP
jgi:glutamate-1-semialdehyde 2,1-aminomutase